VIAFLDASALIYLIEGTEPFASRMRRALARLATRDRKLDVAVSRLSWLECRIRPARNREDDVLALYDDFFARPDLNWMGLTQNVVELATTIRIRHGLRTPDALQAASCLQFGSGHRFITGDAAFRKVGGLHVLQLS